MDKLPTDIQFMIIKDLNPKSLLILIKQYPYIKDLVRDTMNILIKYYIEEYEYEGYLWRDNNTIDDFIENLKIRHSMEPINNQIIYEISKRRSYRRSNENIHLINDIRHFKMFSMLVKKLHIDYDIGWFHDHYMDYKDPEKYAQEDANARIHSMYEIIRMYPNYVELADDSRNILYGFDEIYNLNENELIIFYNTVDEYISRGCPAYYIIDMYFMNKEAFDYYLNKGLSPKLSYRIACDFDGRTDLSDEELLEEYGWVDFDNDLQKEIKEYMRNKSNNN
jgi:hypothetical protein